MCLALLDVAEVLKAWLLDILFTNDNFPWRYIGTVKRKYYKMKTDL